MKAISLLLLTACGCSQAVARYEPPLLRHPTLPQAYAITTCSLNNLPVILMDSLTWESPDMEIILRHEKVHAHRAQAYRGGCWPYMYRIARDRGFRAHEQVLAFCVAGRFAVERNRNPESVWRYIVDVMAADTTLADKDNCLFEEGK